MPTRVRGGVNRRPSEPYFYGEVSRGTSLTIPVSIRTPEDTPVNLEGLAVTFTIKQVQFDFDREDEFSYVNKDFYPQEPLEGRFLIELTSDDLDFPPGEYFFDIQLRHPDTGAVHRLALFDFRLTGAPTNRTVNPGDGQLMIGQEITMIRLMEGHPIIVIAPMMALSPSLYGPIADLQQAYADLQDKFDQLSQRVEDLEDVVAP